MEERNEVMYAEENYETEVATNEERSNSGFGKGVFTGALLTLAGVAIVKGVKKVRTKIKAKKEQSSIVVTDFQESNEA